MTAGLGVRWKLWKALEACTFYKVYDGKGAVTLSEHLTLDRSINSAVSKSPCPSCVG